MSQTTKGLKVTNSQLEEQMSRMKVAAAKLGAAQDDLGIN